MTALVTGSQERRHDVGNKILVGRLLALIVAFISTFVVAAVTKADRAVEKAQHACAETEKNEIKIVNLGDDIRAMRIDIKEIKQLLLQRR